MAGIGSAHEGKHLCPAISEHARSGTLARRAVVRGGAAGRARRRWRALCAGTSAGARRRDAVRLLPGCLMPSLPPDHRRSSPATLSPRPNWPALTAAAYRGFGHRAVAPLVQLDERLWLLELFHGPTLAFKDLALQLVGQLFDAVLARRGERVTIVGATSGDTGSAAIAACRDRAAIDIFILYPQGRISEVQRRQMTTVEAANAHALAIEGTFDDCQDIVKALFADTGTAPRRSTCRRSIRSIARASPRRSSTISPPRWRSVRPAAARSRSACRPAISATSMPATWRARWGCRSSGWSSAPTRNDILARYLATGEMTIAPVDASLSPSMDIQVSSNFERLLFELKGRNGAAVAASMRAFRAGRPAAAGRSGLACGARLVFRPQGRRHSRPCRRSPTPMPQAGMLIDPHTAVAVAAARAELGRIATARRWWRSLAPIQRNFPTRSSAPPASARAFRPALADRIDRPSGSRCCPTIWARVRQFITRIQARRGGRAA